MCDGTTAIIAVQSDKIHKVNVQDIKVTYILKKCVPHEKSSGHDSKYLVHQNLMEDLKWTLNLKILQYLKGKFVGSSQVQNDQTSLTQNMSLSDTQSTPQNILVQIT